MRVPTEQPTAIPATAPVLIPWELRTASGNDEDELEDELGDEPEPDGVAVVGT